MGRRRASDGIAFEGERLVLSLSLKRQVGLREIHVKAVYVE